MTRTWGMLGVSLRSPDTRDALAPQDCLYTRAERDGTGERLEVMATLTGLAVGAAEALRHLPIPRSASSPSPSPRRATRFPTRPTPRPSPRFSPPPCERRRAAGLAPFTVLSCDNLPGERRHHAPRA